MIGEFHAPHEESSDGPGFARRADPVAHRVDGQTRAGVKVRRRLVSGFGHQPTHVTIARLKFKKIKKNKIIRNCTAKFKQKIERISWSKKNSKFLKSLSVNKIENQTRLKGGVTTNQRGPPVVRYFSLLTDEH
jgi:hypothetical protein